VGARNRRFWRGVLCMTDVELETELLYHLERQIEQNKAEQYQSL
jgi:hypothetical protein